MSNIVNVTQETGTNTYTYTVPVGREALLNWVHAVYTASADVGTRQVVLQVLDASDNLITDFHAGDTQVESTALHYNFMTGIYRETAFVNSEIQVPISERLAVPAGWKIVIKDDNGVSGNDGMTINLQYEDLN